MVSSGLFRFVIYVYKSAYDMHNFMFEHELSYTNIYMPHSLAFDTSNQPGASQGYPRKKKNTFV